MKMSSPRTSPWGKVQQSKEISEGIFNVSTAGHGGIMVSLDIARGLTSYTQENGILSGQYLCFEEDCDWALVAFELKLFQDKKDIILNTLINWHPEYVELFLKSKLTEEQTENLNERLKQLKQEIERSRMVKENSPKLIVSALSVTSLSDINRTLNIKANSATQVVQILSKIGVMKSPDKLEQLLESKSNVLVAVWTADDKIHLVDGYPNSRSAITLLADCGNLLFSST